MCHHVLNRVCYKLGDSLHDSAKWQKVFLFHKASRRALGSTQTPTQWVPKVISLWGETDYSLPSSAEVNNEWRHTSTVSLCPNAVDRDNFTFLFTMS